MPFNKKNRSKKLSPAYNKPELGTWYPNRAKIININSGMIDMINTNGIKSTYSDTDDIIKSLKNGKY